MTRRTYLRYLCQRKQVPQARLFSFWWTRRQMSNINRVKWKLLCGDFSSHHPQYPDVEEPIYFLYTQKLTTYIIANSTHSTLMIPKIIQERTVIRWAATSVFASSWTVARLHRRWPAQPCPFACFALGQEHASSLRPGRCLDRSTSEHTREA